MFVHYSVLKFNNLKFLPLYKIDLYTKLSSLDYTTMIHSINKNWVEALKHNENLNRKKLKKAKIAYVLTYWNLVFICISLFILITTKIKL